MGDDQSEATGFSDWVDTSYRRFRCGKYCAGMGDEERPTRSLMKLRGRGIDQENTPKMYDATRFRPALPLTGTQSAHPLGLPFPWTCF